MYYLGIDGGGAYSRIIGVDENMKVLGRHVGNSTNLCSNSYEVVKDNVDKLIKEFNKLTFTKPEDCLALCIGSAGIDNSEYVQEMEQLLVEIGLACPLKVVNDAELILATETRGGAGIAVISGTGSIGYAIDRQGQICRCGGWGFLIDDGGSGYSIGMQAIRYAFMSYDGRLPKTVLEDKVKELLGVTDMESVLAYIYSDRFNKSKIAELALIVKYAAEAGDKSAKIIEQAAAGELYLIARALIKKCELFDCKIVLSGSVILLNDSIKSQFTQLVQKDFKNVQIVAAKEKAEMGAIYLAMNIRTDKH